MDAYLTYCLTYFEPGYIIQTAEAQETEPVGCRYINKSMRHASTHDMGLFFHLTVEDAFG